jgi:hypothetical protein
MVNVSKKYLEENLKKTVWESFKKEIKNVGIGTYWQRHIGRGHTYRNISLKHKSMKI